MIPRGMFFGAAALLAVPAAARAQAIDLSSGGPVDVTAVGGFEWHQDKQEVIATGDARATRGDVTILADRLIAFYRKKAAAPGQASTPAPAPPPSAAPQSGVGGLGEADTGDSEVYRLQAEGHVQIFTPTDHATGERAIYDIDQAVLVMTGKDLKITTPQQVMTARDTMEYWSQKHMAVARGDAVIVTSDARRISADTLVGYTEDPNATPGQHVTEVATSPPAATGKSPADPIGTSGKLKLVEAFGNVEVRTIQDTVRGDRGIYVPDTGIARLVGHVRITHGQNQVNGPAADVNMKSGIAHLLSGPTERVTGLIIPNDPSLQGAGQGPAPAQGKKPPGPPR
jgi:lipopolysaccharide export system protein LptA